ncbi:TadE family protein [Lignipirellula cremea]|uniref:TadE-like protein n=1 Tax=Lignipirellula cremea TaxID=2528010 RepID=A0A518DY09_9BACT|nr:TadE family protein [Lignipirellula cremea]QDU96733.1 TadE-like protein [Lignipirellula cremea]
MFLQSQSRRTNRRGAVTVEFAVVAPVFLVILLGVAEASRLYEMQGQMASAAREGARIAAMDREGILQPGQTTNDKVIADVRNILTANGLPGDELVIRITEADDPDTDFDLDDSDNDLRLFQLRIELPYSAVNPYGVPGVDETSLGASVVFRNARSTLVQ